MKHLNYLATVYKAMTAFAVLGGLVTFGVGAWVMDQPDTEPWSIAVVIGAGVMSILIGALFFHAAGKVAQGEGRNLATVLAVLQLGNCPGILVAGYTVWICWINEETKAVFEAGGLGAAPTTGAPLSSPTDGSGGEASQGLGGSTRDESGGPLGGPT